MRRTSSSVLLFGVLSLPVVASPLSAQNAPVGTGTWTAVEAALGRPGAMQPGNVIKFSFPRSDLSVVADGVTLKPALALG